MKRIDSIDFTRGLVMIIMALDHTRDFLHTGSISASPTDLASTTPILFFTRWITHLCAPSFVFLAGVSAYISSRKHSSPEAIHRHRSWLLRRGIWLIFLEFSIVNFALWMDPRFNTFIFEVIGAIGAGFILLSLVYSIPPRILSVIGLLIIFGHDLLNTVMIPGGPAIKFISSLLFGPSLTPLGAGRVLIIGYPIIPWFGIMLTGFSAGRLFMLPQDTRKKWLARIGLSAIMLFILLRCANIYGDPAPWSIRKSPVVSFLSFMNVSKYPPSLLFTLPTLGIMFLFLSAFEGKNNALTAITAVYGRTPLFYFILHMYIIHALMFVMVFAQGFHASDLVFGAAKFGRPKGSGIALPYVYLVWIAVVISLYPLCKWFGRYRTDHPDAAWLKYL